MPLQDQPRIRKAFIAGAVALALSGTGAAIAWSADSPFPAPSPSQSAPSQSAPGQSAPGQEKKQDKPGKPDKSAKPGKPGKPDKSQRPQLQHSESVVKNADGTFQTIVEQRGTVEAVSETSITVKSEDGFSRSYAVNAETRITKTPATGEDGKLVRPGDGSIADISPGEAVRISGVKSGDQAAAGRIAEGAGDVPGLGLGRGSGMGHGHARGQSQ